MCTWVGTWVGGVGGQGTWVIEARGWVEKVRVYMGGHVGGYVGGWERMGGPMR